MTNEEARDWIRKHNAPDDKSNWCEGVTAMNLAIEALEKRIQKKVIPVSGVTLTVADGTKYNATGMCPGCGMAIINNCIPRYCAWCGQAIDRGDEV